MFWIAVLSVLPRPWFDRWLAITLQGPGRIDNTFVVDNTTFAFVARMEALRPAVAAVVKGAPLTMARFDHWLATFRYIQAAGQVGDAMRRIAEASGLAVDAIRRGDERSFGKLWDSSMLPLRGELVNHTAEMINQLTLTVHDTGALGALANAQQYMLPMVTSTTDLAYKALHARCKPSSEVVCYNEHGPKGRVFLFEPGGIGARQGTEFTPGSCSDSLTEDRCAAVAHMQVHMQPLSPFVCVGLSDRPVLFVGAISGARCSVTRQTAATRTPQSNRPISVDAQ